tara:strand:- start:69 stop:923 length:855 start_codon:yes stop_codon:yes gene_type:complete
MINFFLNYKTKKVNSLPPSISDVENSNKILFSIFTRYGDTIIDLVIIKEFIEEYPDKDYLILCPKQMRPYVSEIIPNVRCIDINKRNLFELLKIDLELKKWRPDIGFNPWSNGLDSCFFISYCKKFLFYKDFLMPQTINHYQVVRRYLNLKEKEWKIVNLVSKENYKNILICPESTDSERSISSDQLDKIISEVESDFDSPDITIASMRLEYLRDNINSFVFKKKAISSQNFIKLVKGSDLIICADSAPLHIASALKKHVFAVFYSTKPEVVINSGDKLTIYTG